MTTSVKNLSIQSNSITAGKQSQQGLRDSFENPAQQSERKEVINWLRENNYPPLPVAPAQDARKYPKIVQADAGEGTWNHCPLTPELQPIPLYTGKNPSYLDQDGKPHLVKHRQYQKHLPKERELKNWFVNPLNGVGTLGGWNNTVWLDFDVKQFASQEECDTAVFKILERPELQNTFVERSHSGGWRIGVRVSAKPNFTNFALSPSGSHVGEALGEGRFTVLAPTIGPSSNPYQSMNRALPVEVWSLESIGIYPISSKTQTQTQKTPHQPLSKPSNHSPIPGSISLEELGNDTSREILQGSCPTGDRSEALVTASQEWYGWQNWARGNDIPITGTPEDLAHYAGLQLGLDSERIERIIKTIDIISCNPAALHRGGEESCWKKIRRLDKATFEQKCPTLLKNQLKVESRQQGNGKNNSSKKVLPLTNHSERNSAGNAGGNGTSNGCGNGSDEPEEPNNWNEPVSWKGEIGWLVPVKKPVFETEPITGETVQVLDDKGKPVVETAMVFNPKCNFDFQIEQELSSVDNEDGGGIVLQVKRSLDLEPKRVIIKSVDYGSAKDFETALKKALGDGIVVNLKSDQLKALIHVRLREYRQRGGRKYRLADRIGQQEDGTWVFANKQFTKDGQPTSQEESGWVYNPQVSPTDAFASPQILDEDSKALRNLIEAQKKVAGSNFMRFLLCNGYVAACLNEQLVVDTERFMPIFNPFGDPGGGKTVGISSALSLVWGTSAQSGMCSASESYLYERLRRYGSIPSLWDDPPSKRREDKEKLDELIKRNYGKFARRVRGSDQQPHSSFIPTTNHACGDTLPAAKSRGINLFFPVTGDLDFSYQPELEEAKAKATGAFRQIISIGYDRNQVCEVRARLQKHLPTAHDRAAIHLAILVWYTQKVVDLAGVGIDVETWVIQNLCAELNEAQTGLNSIADFVERFITAKSQSAIGSWNFGLVKSTEHGQCLAIHMPSVWPAIESGDPPPYNRSVLERVLVEKGALKNKPAKLDRDRDSTLAYQREIHKGRNEGDGWISPSKPKPVNRKCLLIPQQLWGDLGFLLVVPDDERGGGNDGLVTSGNLEVTKVTSSNLEEVTSYELDKSSLSDSFFPPSNQVTQKYIEEEKKESQKEKKKDPPPWTNSRSDEAKENEPLQNLVTWLPSQQREPETVENTEVELVTFEGYSEVTSAEKEVTSPLEMTVDESASVGNLPQSEYICNKAVTGLVELPNGKRQLREITPGTRVTLTDEEHSSENLVFVRPVESEWLGGIAVTRDSLKLIE